MLLRDRWPRKVSLLRFGSATEIGVPAVFEGSRVTVGVPASRLIGIGGGMHLTAAVGHPRQPVTDVAPDAGYFAIP